MVCGRDSVSMQLVTAKLDDLPDREIYLLPCRLPNKCADQEQRDLHQIRVDERIRVGHGELCVALRDEHAQESVPAVRGFSIVSGN